VLGGESFWVADLYSKSNLPSRNLSILYWINIACFFGSVGDAGASIAPSYTKNIFQKGIEVVKHCSVCGEL